MVSALIEFTERALAKGLERDDITQTLRAAGWPKDEVDAALDALAAVDFPLPIPKPKPHVSARATLIYLLLFSSLYASIWSFVSLVFTIIDKALPDPLKDRLQQYLDSDDWISWDVATLIVFFPLFLFMFRLAYRARAHDPGRRASGVQKWLTYLTLFIAASCLAGDGVSLVYNLLSGETTSRFLLKTVTVAIVAGGVFVYFLNDARRDEQE
jgi:Domain of unknown function (DUF5671)